MHVEILSGRRAMLAGGSITYGEDQIVEALTELRLPASSTAAVIRDETEQLVGHLFDAMEERNMQESLDDELETNGAPSQLDAVVDYIKNATHLVPHDEEQPADFVIRTIQHLQKQVVIKDAVNVVLKTEMDARTSSLYRIDRAVHQLLEAQGLPPQRVELRVA